jgi:hypothetical protein
MQSQATEQALEPAPVVGLRPSRKLRLRGAALAAPCLAALILSACLVPRKAGHGTHEALRLPPCTFFARTGYPCPSCGMTTSFANMARGRVGRAFLAHPFGVVFFVAAVLVALVGLAELLSGQDFLRLLRPGVWWAIVVGVALFGGWAFKVVYGMSNGMLPLR